MYGYVYACVAQLGGGGGVPKDAGEMRTTIEQQIAVDWYAKKKKDMKNEQKIEHIIYRCSIQAGSRNECLH